MKKANLFAGLFAILAAVVFLIPALDQNFLDGSGRPAAGFLPVVLSVILFLMGLGLTWRSWRSRDEASFGINNKAMFFKALAIVVAMPVIMFYFGFLPAGLICVFLFCLTIGVKPVKALIATVLIVLVIYVLFKFGLSVRLPQGRLF